MAPARAPAYAGSLNETFQHRFCRHFGVPAERFGEAMLQRTLYWHARWLRWFGARDSMVADRTFIASLGRLTRRRDFPGEVVEFREDDRNLAFGRRVLRLRVSIAKAQDVFRAVWPEGGASPPATEPVAGAGCRPVPQAAPAGGR